MDPTLLIRRALASEVSGEGKLLRGLIPYNSPTRVTEMRRTFIEVIRPGAFARSLAGKGQVMNGEVISTFNHNPDRMLGRTSSGTLRLSDSPRGLVYEVDLPDSAVDVKELLARGDLRGSSFMAPNATIRDRWKGSERELLDVDLFEVGPVVMPIYPTSEASVRSGEPMPPPEGTALRKARLRLMERS